MIDKIIAYSIQNKLIIGLFTISIICAGIWSMTKVPIDAVPDITNNQVQIITQAPNLGTVDIEQFVTYPIEIAMANMPGVKEIRSVSRFGLSVVTIVFDDDMDTYLPRQLVAEKLVEVQTEIPEGFGIPYIGPISTGLGEIYQYSLEVAPEYKEEFSLTDLRTIQDWTVRRQMALVPGVIEVNAVGGHVKQYEIAVDPNELNAIGISISDILTALENNNQNTGGAYIEKNHQSNFIRGDGLARSLEDLENIVIALHDGYPITIKDVADVRYGHAVKYGALTKNGQGEAVGGMILMLKGANSNEVIQAVKERMEAIEKSLPDGVTIEPFLDRSSLIASTTNTVITNLTEGALIVIFILVFLLGNWRGGLIVASTIPLSLLFAFILMNVFDVWANLMSLGAIDFGIIVDGAVIIVEGTVFTFHRYLTKNKTLDQARRDKLAGESASKMMNAAFFGQLIILIVFIPILALEGVEGKMFKPMALTFMFAMIGVMVLCLTYVPMMSAWFLRIKKTDKVSRSDRFVQRIESAYDRQLVRALRHSKAILLAVVVVLALAIFAFTKLGGAFIPQLDEGDIAFHAMLKPGSSLSETIETTTHIEQILMDQFPEALQVICRIGVADVPTDPMPMDIADCFIILKESDEWVSADSKAELVEKMKAAVSIIPGVNFEFTQPIEMRFNELLTGVREDVAIKLFGEDLDVLALKAEEIGRLISGIEGIADMKVEATDGLPQMTVNFDRRKIAQYGLDISSLNTLIESAFAGGHAGEIFEGEKRFELVVRLKEESRQGIDNLQNLYVSLPNGSQIPLKEVASISYEPGPMQISRDNTNRRTYVGVNVRGRDIKSVVEEIQEKIDSEFELPPGYYIRYGGTFENLERATARLTILVPVALGLIFILIFFALKSIKQSAMIFIAIPLAALGGVFSLWLRGMPFSISAGVGFIVLFGVAVLNGLVLISSWNELKENGVTDLNERIRLGAKGRIRPIMLTALTDIFGFLPMAFSTSAGAEVQQPLATVVIGGMVTATLLTLFVLPILYRWMEKRNTNDNMTKPAIAIVLCLLATPMMAQNNGVINSPDQAIELGIANNGHIDIARKRVMIQDANRKSAFNIDKTDVNMSYGQFNSFENDVIFEVAQKFAFPTVYGKQKKLANEQVSESELVLSSEENLLRQSIRNIWNELAYLQEHEKLVLYQDSLFQRFLKASEIRYQTEETSFLEFVAAETQLMEIQNTRDIVQADIRIAQEQLNMLVNDSVAWDFRPATFEKYEGNFVMKPDSVSNPELRLAQQRITVAEVNTRVQKAKMLPDISLGYFNQSLIGAPLSDGGIATSSNRFSGFQAGLSIPLFYGSYRADVKKAQIEKQVAMTEANYYQKVVQRQYERRLQDIGKWQSSLTYYETKALKQADLVIQNANLSFENGAINYVEYLRNLDSGLQLKMKYLETLKAYNGAMINMNHLLGL